MQNQPPLTRRSRPTPNHWLLPLAFLACFTGARGAEEDAAPDASALAKDLKKAMAAQNFSVASSLATQLLEIGGASAVDAVVEVVFTGADYDLEKAIGGALVALTDAAARARVLELVRSDKNPRAKSRVILVTVVSRYAATDAAALAALHGALKDPSKAVVFAAVQRITELKKRESVVPLAKELVARNRKAHDRVYHDILKALQLITGLNIEVAADWENYAATTAGSAGTAAPPQPPQHKSGGLTSVFKRPSFFSMEVNSDRVLFVIDISWSMTERDPELPPPPPPPPEVVEPETTTSPGGTTVVVKKKVSAEKKTAPKPTGPPPANRERMYRVKEELTRALGSLPTSTRFGILSFSHELAWWGGSAGALKEASPANKSNAAAWVRSLLPAGATRTDLALEAALAMQDIDTIYLLTDGAPKDESNQRLEIEPILARAKELNRFLRARIHTISFAQIRDTRMRTFVQRLATQNDGVCTWLP